MNMKDITKQILELHETEEILKLMNEVKDDLRDGIPSELSMELDLLLAKANEQKIVESDNVIAFRTRRHPSLVKPLAEAELLAAAGRSLGEWISQPITFGGAGFILDVRRVIGSENQVDLYLTPSHPDTKKMRKTLESYLGKSMHIGISNDDVELLDAEIYIDENGNAAEGRGHLLETDDLSSIKGKISIHILLED